MKSTDVSRPAGSMAASRPTLTDVARLAGVSVATASKALNGRRQVRAETRTRVKEAAEQLSFRPNPLARSLLAGRTGTVGLLTSDLEGRFSIPILMGAEDAFGAGRAAVFLCDARGDSIREQHHVQALLERRVDGLIVVGSRTDPRPSLGRELPVPVVYAYAPSSDLDHDLSIVPDGVGAAHMAVQHLLSSGRTRIAHITGDIGYLAARERAEGTVQALAAADLGLVEEPLYGNWSEGWGRAAAAMLLDRREETDAILCGSDQIARGVLDTLRERGHSVPGDVAVMGFDNWRAFTDGARPGLTSVDHNLQGIGSAAAQALFQAMDGQTRSGVELQPGRLVIRSSTVAVG
ncbi:LacI family DNA-binding transcriptional regulator [Streptomyces sp. NPDC079167]|uniref:LacI family DNA-binding transcriptional regulator n=1 Tax=Streptomyces sp. NPDC079167 TaxID=3154513 RepID=UPI0034447195